MVVLSWYKNSPDKQSGPTVQLAYKSDKCLKKTFSTVKSTLLGKSKEEMPNEGVSRSKWITEKTEEKYVVNKLAASRS